MRAAAALIALVTALVLAGCGGSSGEAGSPATTTTASAPATDSLEALWRAGAEAIGATPGTSDHGPGVNRISFLVIDRKGAPVEAATADLWLATGLKAKPYARTVARLVRIGLPGAPAAEVQHLYVATVRVPRAGKYWYLAAPRGTGVRALGNILVREHAEAPEVGDRAIPSRTPTLRSTGGDLGALSTARTPDRSLYASSVKEAMDAGVPFVVTFATPLFCQTRLCGPVVDVVGAVRRQFAKTDVRFVHVEVYKDNDPAEGVNAWMTEWNLPTEPWTFVVDRTGRVAARFENAMSTAELVAAVDKVAT
jgi:hypothetical protein